jgi:hypothetical protein
MYDLIQMMPGGPAWRSVTITLPEAPNEPQTLYYRPPEECLAELFQNPLFEECMEYAPRTLLEADGVTRVYHEMNTAHAWHEQQVRLTLNRENHLLTSKS